MVMSVLLKIACQAMPANASAGQTSSLTLPWPAHLRRRKSSQRCSCSMKRKRRTMRWAVQSNRQSSSTQLARLRTLMMKRKSRDCRSHRMRALLLWRRTRSRSNHSASIASKSKAAVERRRKSNKRLTRVKRAVLAKKPGTQRRNPH